MDSSIIMLFVIQIVLIILNAIFASAEIAVLSVNEAKIEHLVEKGDKKAKRLNKLKKEPDRFLSTIQIAITLSGFLGSAFAADGFSDPLVELLISLGVTIPKGTLNVIAVIFITLILSYFTLIFGELVPKRIAMKKSEELALMVSGIVSGISTIFKPIVTLLSASTNAILRLVGIDPNESEEKVSEEEILMMVETGGETGAIDKEEQTFIKNIFEFDDLTASDILTHRTDIDILWSEDSDEVWEETVCGSTYSRYPICGESPDDIVGILNARNYLRLKDKSRENVMKTVVETPYFVPETINADVLFFKMKRTHNALAVVLDEYGGMAGIITLSDLIEELVGELKEGPDSDYEDEPSITQIDDDTWQVKGNVDIDEIEEALGIDIDTEDVNTFTGLVFDHLNGIPDDGETNIELELGDIFVVIKKIQDHQVELAQIKKINTTEEIETEE